MHLLFAFVYGAVAIIDFVIALNLIRSKDKVTFMLANCTGAAGTLTLIYLISILSPIHIIASTANVICLCFVVVMLLYLLCFLLDFLYGSLHARNGLLWAVRVFMVLSAIDFVVLLLNPFFGHVATYTFIDMYSVPHFHFTAQPGYIYHLTLCYCMVASSVYIMLHRARRVPRMYRGPIYRVLLCVLCAVCANAIYLAFFVRDTADATIIMYSILIYLIYFNVHVYGNKDALESTARNVLDASAQPTMVFDFQDKLFFYNKGSATLFKEFIGRGGANDYRDFIRFLNAQDQFPLDVTHVRFYWTPDKQREYSYICDCQKLVDHKNRQTARMLVFTSNTMNTDQLTGFLTEEYFDTHHLGLVGLYEPPVQVALCDITQLGLLNNTLGYNRGDDAILHAAHALRAHFSDKAVFVRLRDAKLMALCFGILQEEIKERFALVNADLAECAEFNLPLKVDFSIAKMHENEALTDTVARALSALQTAKLLDADTRHSSAIDSLIQMLSECDGETEGHVQRTRALGDGLAFEMGLSDYERNQLSLLCLFHDIGKIGIPSSILNKPGKLTDQERSIMQEHVQKGYRIARATSGLEIIAEPILHHHERWDGTGYPDGLEGEAIPTLSRIISVVDAYDAMVSDRPYHTGISSEEACRELLRCAGEQFDPHIVDTFVLMLHEEAGDKEPQELTDEARETPHITGEPAIPSKVDMVGAVKYSRYVLDEDMNILEVDDVFEALTGYTAYDVESMHLTQDSLIFEEDREAYWQLMTELKGDGNAAYLEHRIRCKDGTGRYVYCFGVWTQVDGQTRINVVVTEIADSLSMKHEVSLVRNRAMMSLRRLEETVQQDPMTGLFNQPAFFKRCERALLDADKRCVLVMVDVDDFKDYNDTYGHPKGDLLLIDVARILVASSGDDGIVGRVGGDEFCCLLTFDRECSLAGIREGLQEFWEGLNRRRDSLELEVTFSAGAAWPAQGEVDLKPVYARADEAMYRAKRGGKNRIDTAGK